MKELDRFSFQYIEALVECITGGPAWSKAPPVGLYRTGPQIVAFFRSLGHGVTYGNWSRVPFTRELLTEINNKENGLKEIIRVTERLLEPRDYVGHEDKLEKVVSYLNKYLKYDGFEIVRIGSVYRLVKSGGTAPVIELFESKAIYLSLTNVKNDFERALSSIDADSESAITSACSTLESVAKSILEALGREFPRDQSIQPLVAAVLKELKLAPDQHSEAEIRRILGSLMNIVAGVGVLRTRYGDAYGRGRAHPRLLPRHARLVINSASTVGLFLLETYLDLQR